MARNDTLARAKISESLKRAHAEGRHRGNTKPNSTSFTNGLIPWNRGKRGVMKAWNKGRKLHYEVWNKSKKLPYPIWNKGKKVPQQSGERHWAWKTDRAKVKVDEHNERGSPLHKQWSRSVKNRDGWKCRIANQKCSGKAVAHHILAFVTHPELRYEVNNGITLCHFHHPRKRNDEMRLIPFFQKLVAIRAN